MSRRPRPFLPVHFIPADPRLKKPCHDHGVLSRIHRKTLAARQGWRSTGSLVAFGKEAHERQADR
ncbi:MAG: hypothetical protein AAAB11_18415, partial [Rhizobium giardinii]